MQTAALDFGGPDVAVVIVAVVVAVAADAAAVASEKLIPVGGQTHGLGRVVVAVVNGNIVQRFEILEFVWVHRSR